MEQRYENQSEFCSQEQARAAEDINAIQKHTERMNALRRKRQAASNAGGFVRGLGEAIQGNPLALVAAGEERVSGNYATQIEQAEADFQAQTQIRSIEANIRQCFFEADQLKVGIDASYLEIQRRLVDVELAVLQLENQIRSVSSLVAEGRAALARETGRDLPSIAFHYWIEQRVDRFRRDFAWAKRLAYLSVRAVEYEYQQSMDLTDDVLRATTPAELQDVLLALQREQAGRTINGRRPDESSVVLSLRGDVLEVGDRWAPAPGERAWDASRRFGERLRSPAFGLYDDDGNYLGQGIPFTLKSTGALDLRCAERLWRITATIQGDVIEASTPSVPVIVLKRNTFSSQWCDGRGDGSTAQSGTVRPSAELFRPDGTLGDLDDANGYSSALVYPWFNVVRSEFYRDPYTEGSSEELAGRGLYGDYILLFPDSGLLEWTDGDAENDFPLHRIEDVLIRFDLLSVDDIAL